MSIFGCTHDWGFPRRRDGVDYQTCLRGCGASRESPVQFGYGAVGHSHRAGFQAADSPAGEAAVGRMLSAPPRIPASQRENSRAARVTAAREVDKGGVAGRGFWLRRLFGGAA